ncbi:MAG: PQQ-dependent sugar dehydrogenase [Pseudomonadota bacterium]
MKKSLLRPALLSALLLGASHQGLAADPISAVDPGAKGAGDARRQKNLADPAPIGNTEITIETIADGLTAPWCIAFLPNGDILVSERPGRLRRISNGALTPEPIKGVPPVLASGQGGLFDILPHPDFSENSVVFLSYAHGTRRANALRIARAVLNGDTLENLEVIYEASPLKDTSLHFGGKLQIGGDGMLYATTGEGSKYKERAQDLSTSFGAVIRIAQDGTIPTDNPSFKEGALPEHFTKGHRNPQGLAYDPVRNILWEHEHGPRGGDEINIIRAGENYGWPLASYGIDYNGALVTPYTEYQGTTQPFKYWTPSIATSGLAVYRGDLFPDDWDGDLLVGGLADRALHRVDLDGTEEVGEERYLGDEDERIRDVRVGPDGAIYVATSADDSAATGRILRLTPAQ